MIMTQIDNKSAQIEWLQADIDRLKEQVRQLQENGCLVWDEDDNICQIAQKNIELREEINRLKSTGGRAVLEEFVGKVRKAGE
jgi:cell division protein FtsB